MTHALFWVANVRTAGLVDSASPTGTRASAYRCPSSRYASSLEPVRVLRVAQVAAFATAIAVDAPRPVVTLALLASLALFA
jgi:hypothetical protein